MVAKGAGGVRGGERSSEVPFNEKTKTSVRCSKQAGDHYTRGDGDFFLLSGFFGSIFVVFAVLLCRAVLSFSYMRLPT